MPTKDEYVAAAKVMPLHRTPEQQRLVDQGSNIQEVRNADHAARKEQKVYGK